MRTHLLSLAAVTLSAASAFATSDRDLRATLEHRFKDDRTGACVAAAVIETGATASAYFCADPRSQRPYDERTAFEIGSATAEMRINARLAAVTAVQKCTKIVRAAYDASGASAVRRARVLQRLFARRQLPATPNIGQQSLA
jgi:hypothetical protein